MGVPGAVVRRVRAGGGWSRSSPRPQGVAVAPATTDRSPHGAPRRTIRPTARHDGPFAPRRATTDHSPHGAPRRTVRRTARHYGPLAAYGAKGPGWGVSARSGRRPLPSTAQGTEPPDRGRTPPTPAPTHHTPARATKTPTEPKQAAAGTQGRGELRTTPAPTHPHI